MHTLMILFESYIGVATSDGPENSCKVFLEFLEDFRDVLFLFMLALVHHAVEFGLSLQKLLVKVTLFVELTAVKVDLSKEKLLLGCIEVSPFAMHA